MDAFYLPDGARLVATASTRGPWSDDHQHAGPPSALIARAGEAATPGFQLARLTIEMLRPIPLGTVDVEVRITKPGRKVIGLEGALSVDGVLCLSARMVTVRAAAVDVPTTDFAPPMPPPEASEPFTFDFFRNPVAYHAAMEARRAHGRWGSGQMALWMRTRVPLVAGETPSGVQRVLIAADAGSGVTAALDPQAFTFLNADLTVHLLRPPVGEWVLLDGVTTVGAVGRALADCRLGDVAGTLGRGLQTLVVEPR